MTGRGRPRRAKSPDTKTAKSQTSPEETDRVALQKQIGTTKKRSPKVEKKTRDTEEKPSQKNVIEEIGKQQNATTENKKAPVECTKAKTCAARARKTKQAAEEITKTRQETPKETTKAPMKTTKAKKSGGKAKSPERCSEEMTKKQPETPKETTKASIKTPKAEPCGVKAKSPGNIKETPMKKQPETPKETTKASIKTPKAEPCGVKAKSPGNIKETPMKKQPETPKETTKASIKTPKAEPCGVKAKSPGNIKETPMKKQPETPKETTKASLKTPKAEPCRVKAKSPGNIKETPKNIPKACVPQVRCEDKVDSILYTTLEKLKIKRDERSAAAEIVNRTVKSIIEHLKEKSQSFKEVELPLRTGSYYEHLKISNPDEFDVMLFFPVGRANISPFGGDGAFYSVGLKRGKNPLQKFQEDSTLSASAMLQEFRDEVMKSVKNSTEWEVTRKKPGCPAVTLITKSHPTPISLDIVLSIVVKSSWPPFTKEGIKIDGWLGTKVKQEYKRKPYYLVPKYEGVGNVEHDGVLTKDVWRVSFSHVEKAILQHHGSQKTCCEKGGERCCRKDCLKLLKHLLSLLKERHPSLTKFCSYHAKTTLLHACCARTKDADWRASNLSRCFHLLLVDFIAHLEKVELPNFFIPTQNLLSGPGPGKCKSLAQHIKDERDSGFPIFK
ncbi:cyclic GMP-AMP synthase [Anoplopoma fimbria]|uniref:cyclic GMP-AMP synthase n=1 Tax=Anoplopoma fimbria TaxID=229290 RepID=UPI0023EC4F17|nr:cyclic GMP-AMP synthase [Anoplopoma fimbria]